MSKVKLNRRGLFPKFTAVAVSVMIIISSVAIIEAVVRGSPRNEAELNTIYQSYQSRPFEVSSVLAQGGLWVSFDSSAPGTPAKSHVTISDTSGITIVVDFHGFWRRNYTLDTTLYDDLDMPGASSIYRPGKPVLPLLFEYVEIPHDVDISIEVLASSNGTANGYNIRPALPPNYPVALGEHHLYNGTPPSTSLPAFFSSVYSQPSFFPSNSTSVTGETGTRPLIMRGHRLLGLSFYPVQYNPITSIVLVYSQIVVKIKYSHPAQIQPVPDSLRSEAFERILSNSLLYYDSSHVKYLPRPGFPSIYSRTMSPPPSMPNATIPQFQQSSIPPGYEQGAEYMIITTDSFKLQAQRLAEWKERKGIPSEVMIIPTDISREKKIENVKGLIKFAYDHWYPAPTYVLLFGDVNAIPSNYDMLHPGMVTRSTPYFQDGYTASDLSYFNVQGYSYFPDIIYSRISVDTEEQAEIVVDKILRYEQSPPPEDLFYKSILSAGYFEDKKPRNGREDTGTPFIFRLERIRKFLEEFDYNVHYNYSAAVNHASPRLYGVQLYLDSNPDSNKVSYTIPSEYDWLWGYDDREEYRNKARNNITANINDGRFLVMYYSHGGSKNMKYYINRPYTTDNRDLVEGWHTPTFDTSHFSHLANGNMTPLILSIACNTGWFDGETDELVLNLYDSEGNPLDENPFEEYELESFAEEITRMEGGAIAAFAPSRPVPADVSGDLLDAIIEAFWPGLLESGRQPVYEMGVAILNGKLDSAGKYSNTGHDREMFEAFHLFGDPETQLWTEAPTQLNVSHPSIIGTTNPQKFVVTVRNNDTGEPVDYAKVCIQQDPYIYQVGYTDSKGQVIFDVDPRDSSSYLNVTTTKHNYEPYIGDIIVSKSFDAEVTVSPESILRFQSILFNVSGFNEEQDVEIYLDEKFETGIFRGSHLAQWPVPDGPNGYVNVRAKQGSLVAVTRFQRLSSDQNPDPYVYSYADSSTWHLAGDELVWDNPSITIYDGVNPVTRVTQNQVYTVNVTVYNRGSGDADRCRVRLQYAPFGGGVTWKDLGTDEVSVPLFESREATFEWSPQFPNTASLKVILEQENERDEDTINNEGYESWNVFPACSQGESIFQVGNPTEDTEYVFINLRQVRYEDDIWNAAIQDYSSQPIRNGDPELVTMVVDPNKMIGPEDSRFFTAEIYVNATLIGGLAFEGVCEQTCEWLLNFIIILIVVVAVAAIIWYFKIN